MAEFAESHLVRLKSQEWLSNQKHAGKCVAKILKQCKDLALNREPNLSLKDFENLTYKCMEEMDCIPTFKDYHGFPSAICTSVNEQVVHGIVSDYVLKDGDVVKIDLGATFNGAIADSAITCIYGTPKHKDHMRLVDACEKALLSGIGAVKVGNRIGAIGNAIYKNTKNTGFGLITEYGGHGIDTNRPHAAPFVANKAKPTEGLRMQPGMTIAIEPMLVIGKPKTKVLQDGWTVVSPGISSHFEHTLFIDDDKVHVITEREDDCPNYKEN